MLETNQLMRNVIDPKFADLAKGHVIEGLNEVDLTKLAGKMSDMKLDDDGSDDEDDKKP